MAFDPAYLDLMQAPVLHRAKATRDNHGKTTHGTATTLRAKVSRVTGVTRGNDAEEISVTWVVHLPPPGYALGTATVPTVTTEDLMSIDGGTSYLPVQSIDAPHDEDGTAHHQKVML